MLTHNHSRAFHFTSTFNLHSSLGFVNPLIPFHFQSSTENKLRNTQNFTSKLSFSLSLMVDLAGYVVYFLNKSDLHCLRF
ncbi:hypothetical protein QVD17_27509 [Tagetes erecta]|uniref:Uncharacterized protein n=1 Tax=Tagetes erecta TaxID=13708 RepID=A0AAD8NRS1_TARER|nr:hypothetical protein QVD17_27509 [Tagetes erecta]